MVEQMSQTQEQTTFEELKSQHEANKLTLGEYCAQLEDLCKVLQKKLNPEDDKVRAIALILNPDNPDMKGGAKQFAMESMLQ